MILGILDDIECFGHLLEVLGCAFLALCSVSFEKDGGACCTAVK